MGPCAVTGSIGIVHEWRRCCHLRHSRHVFPAPSPTARLRVCCAQLRAQCAAAPSRVLAHQRSEWYGPHVYPIILHFTALHCTVQYCVSCSWTVPYCTSLCCIGLHYVALYSTVLLYPDIFCAPSLTISCCPAGSTVRTCGFRQARMSSTMGTASTSSTPAAALWPSSQVRVFSSCLWSTERK